MAATGRANVDRIPTTAIERSKVLRVGGAKGAGRPYSFKASRLQLGKKSCPGIRRCSTPIPDHHLSIPRRAALAPTRELLSTRRQTHRPTWKRESGCAFKSEARRAEDLEHAIDEARQDMFDTRSANVCPTRKTFSITPTKAKMDIERAFMHSQPPTIEVLMPPNDYDSEAHGAFRQPLQSRYAPKRKASVLQSSSSQVYFGYSGMPAENASPPASRCSRNSKHERKEAATLETIRELEELGKLLAGRRPSPKQVRALSVITVPDQSPLIRQRALRIC